MDETQAYTDGGSGDGSGQGEAPSVAASNDAPSFTGGEPGPKQSPLLWLVLPALGLAGWMLLSGPGEGDAAAAPAEAPALFDTLAKCDKPADLALHRARELWGQADAKAQRYVYAPEDGVEAVTMFARAGACFTRADHAAEAETVRASGARLRRRIERDYTTYRLRLERALAEGRRADARVAVRVLRGLLAHRQGDPYVAWLAEVQRHLATEEGAGS